MLVVAEVALALTLLTGAGLLVKSFARLQGVDPGFDPDRLLTFNLALPPARYPSDTQQIAFFDQVLPALAAVPGMRAVGSTSAVDLELRDRGLSAAAQAAEPLGRHPDRQPRLLRHAADSPAARPHARRAGPRHRASRRGGG